MSGEHDSMKQESTESAAGAGRNLRPSGRGGRQLGWSYFGPLVGRLAEPMGGFTDDELAAVERFLATMSDAVSG